MASLQQTLVELERLRRQWARSLPADPAFAGPSDRLREVAAFGPDPGNLRMLAYVPPLLAAPRALVVVLHGCTQTAAGYDHGSGWSALAERHGFCLLYPEQRAANNPKLCFNWFAEADTRRGEGEVRSIRSMIETMIRAHGIDRSRVHITGLSAGGAMACAMLATSPELFAAGGIVAGLPYGAATSVREAFEAMARGRDRPAEAWGDGIRAASAHRGPWPRITVWHGEADATVAPANAEALVRQWLDVHGIDAASVRNQPVPGASRRIWWGPRGVAVEAWLVPGMGHGTPLKTSGAGDDVCGHAGPFMIEAGISSTFAMAGAWGLTEQRMPARPAEPGGKTGRPGPDLPMRSTEVAASIRRALAAAGLGRPRT